MSRKHPPTATRRVLMAVLVATLGGWPAAETAAADRPIALTIEIHAREVTPGEPVRILVRSPRPLVEVTGSFNDDDVSFSTAPSAAGTQLWVGWGIVPLDAAAGMTTVEIQGTAEDGARALGTRAVTIEPKPFPEEHLDVAPRFVEPPPEVAERLARERGRLAKIYSSRMAYEFAGTGFLRPVPGAPTSVFGTRRIYNGKPRSPHPGLDLRAATGTEVRASGPGRVVLAQDLYYSGNTVIVDHGGGLFTLYAHLSTLGVENGQEVGSGQVVGLSGATGRVTGPHLHWGAKIGSRPFDPMALLDPRLW